MAETHGVPFTSGDAAFDSVLSESEKKMLHRTLVRGPVSEEQKAFHCEKQCRI